MNISIFGAGKCFRNYFPTCWTLKISSNRKCKIWPEIFKQFNVDKNLIFIFLAKIFSFSIKGFSIGSFTILLFEKPLLLVLLWRNAYENSSTLFWRKGQKDCKVLVNQTLFCYRIQSTDLWRKFYDKFFIRLEVSFLVSSRLDCFLFLHRKYATWFGMWMLKFSFYFHNIEKHNL